MSSFVIEPTSDTAGGPATSVPGRMYASRLTRAGASGSPGNRPEAQPAVNRDHLPGDVRRPWPGEEPPPPAHVFRLSQALCRDQLFLDEVARLVADGLGHVGLDEPGGDRVYRHAAARQFNGQGPRERVHRPLAGRVIALPGVH